MQNIRVIDLTQHLSGPYCTWTLSSLGAEIIKVEPVDKGDSARETSPFVEGRSVYFDSVNRGKQSLAIDLKSEDGRAVMTDLIRSADVLIENFRPRVRDRLGFSDDRLLQINPRLVICSISGFGQSGSHSQFPAYDIVAQAMSGMISINGERGTAGVRVGLSIGDIAAGLFATIGILNRLYQRDAAGAQTGAPLDISMVNCQIAMLENAYARYLSAGDVPAPLGSRHPVMTPFETYAASDGQLVVALGSNADWPRFCDAIGAPGLIEHPLYATTELRLANRDALTEALDQRFQISPVAQWLQLLRAARIACAPVMGVADFARSELAEELQAFVGLTTDPDRRFCRNPLAAAVPTSPAPRLGEHSRQILTDLGYAPERIAALERSGTLQHSD